MILLPPVPRLRLISLVVALVSLPLSTVALRAQGPAVAPSIAPVTAFRPGEIWSDDKGVAINAHGGGVLFHQGIYYWYGEHKVTGDAGNYAQVGVHAYSSRDLLHWKDEGIALPVSRDVESDIVAGSIIERPKVLFNAATNKFVMWFHLELKGQGYKAARAGVAVSDRAAGPYTYLRSIRPNAGSWPVNVNDGDKKPYQNNRLLRDFTEGQMARDLTLFQDDDGKAYLIASAEDNATLHVSELTADYLGTTGRYERIIPEGFNEAPVIFKRGGKYYLITSGTSGWAPNAARSFVASAVFGPWKELGNPCRGDEQQNKTTFESQGTYALPVQGKPDAVIFMADRWRPGNPIDGRYVWLPVEWEGDKPVLRPHPAWDLSFFNGGR